MAAPIHITIEPARKLGATAELELLTAAVRQNPHSARLTLRLARMLNKLDMFPETIELLNQNTEVSVNLGAKLALISAYFARNAAGDSALAQQVARGACAFAQTDGERSHVLAELAKAHLRLADAEGALPLLWKALDLDPNNVNAFKRLALELLNQQKSEQVIALTNTLRQRGVGHSRLLAARMMALAASGDSVAAERMLEASHFIHEGLITVPAGWADLAAFNAAIAMEINDNLGMRFERYGTSSQKAWRVDHPATGDTPAVTALSTAIADIATAFAASCAAHDHWWSSFCPQKAVLRSWCVVTEGEGYEKWHMHPEGWMSGGYYVEVPDAVVNGADKAGCFAFGLPGGLIGKAAAQSFAQSQVRPRPGLLTLFPSHAFHRTFPHKGVGRRMCIAFDICPA